MSGDLVYGLPQRITESKAAGDGAWEVSGFAATYDRDLGNDVIHPGAFQDTLASGHKVRFLYAHDPAQPLGTTLELRETDGGLYGRFRISKTRLGEEVRTLLHDEALDSFSIGYRIKDFDYDEATKTRHLKALELGEVSLVCLPMNPAARVTAYKEADYATLTLEQLLATYDTHRIAALGQAEAVAERRLAEGRKLSDGALAILERLRHLAEADAALLLRLATTPPTATPSPAEAPAPVETAGLVEAHLRRARLSELCRAYGVAPP